MEAANEINPEAIKLIIPLALEKIDYSEIAEKANEAGFTTKTGKAWTGSTISYVCREHNIHRQNKKSGYRKKGKLITTDVPERPRTGYHKAAAIHRKLEAGEILTVDEVEFVAQRIYLGSRLPTLQDESL